MLNPISLICFSQEQVIAHIGICAINGFCIQIPYLVKDLADMMYELDTPTFPENNTLPASINMDFNMEEDSEILGLTKDYSYWWNPTAPEMEVPRVTRSITNAHFHQYFLSVRSSISCCIIKAHFRPRRQPRYSMMSNISSIPTLWSLYLVLHQDPTLHRGLRRKQYPLVRDAIPSVKLCN